MILYVAIAGLFGFMFAMVGVSLMDIPELEKSQLRLGSVEVTGVNTIENHAKLKVSFLITNHGERTFVIPVISYELFANGKSLGTSSYSVEDIPMTGRAPFYPGAEIPLDSFLKISLTENNSDEYLAIINGESVEFSVKGQYTIETAWQLVEKDFESSL
jgi:hypothetical protein|tara:strand:- start:217 stop:693 length:477 start_codon:yes stop_codon:yes gene_type:complete